MKSSTKGYGQITRNGFEQQYPTRAIPDFYKQGSGHSCLLPGVASTYIYIHTSYAAAMSNTWYQLLPTAGAKGSIIPVSYRKFLQGIRSRCQEQCLLPGTSYPRLGRYPTRSCFNVYCTSKYMLHQCLTRAIYGTPDFVSKGVDNPCFLPNVASCQRTAVVQLGTSFTARISVPLLSQIEYHTKYRF